MSATILATLAAHIDMVRGLEAMIGPIEQLAERGWATLASGGRILWMGNGGSAADSQHLAAELVGRFARERSGLAALALTTDTSVLTSVANDYGFESVFARQVEALGQAGDLLIGLSTSGNSVNVLRAMEVAGRRGLGRVGLTGATGGALARCTDLCLRVPATDTARIQEAHILIGHLFCDLLERRAVAATGAGG